MTKRDELKTLAGRLRGKENCGGEMSLTDAVALAAAECVLDLEPERPEVWWCPQCRCEVDGIDVTYEQTHDVRAGGCGGTVGVRKRVAAQPTRLKEWYFSVDDCIYETELTELYDGATGTVKLIGKVGSPETAHCYVQPGDDVHEVRATRIDGHNCAQCGQFLPADTRVAIDTKTKLVYCVGCTPRKSGDTLELKEGDEVLIRWNGLNRYRVTHNVIHSVHPPCWSLQRVYKKRDTAQEDGE